MKANETRVDKFLAHNDTTFAIPVYQRNYDWSKTQCSQLLRDIVATGADDNRHAHFIGSIVYVHDDVYSASGLTELTIIDGQQRLTTLTLIYIAVYRLALSTGDERLAERIQQTYLINKFAPDAEKLKLKPTDNNKAALAQILDPEETKKVSGYSRLVENFRFFQSEITPSNLETVLRGLAKLIFVDIALDRQRDNPQRIFESLNSTGLELSQADLIRNYILMGLNRSNQENVYRSFWEPIEGYARTDDTNQSRVSDFIRDYLTLKNKEIPNKGAVYEKFKLRFPEPNSPELQAALGEMKMLAAVYTKLLNPQRETDLDIREELAYINRLEINVAYPFLMPAYLDYEKGVITRVVFLDVLKLVQSFTWRRFIVGLPTNALNKIFMSLYDRIQPADYLGSLQRSLMQRTGGQRFPRDAEVVAMLRDKDIYNTKQRTRMYFFERIENHNNNEHVSIFDNGSITIEHIFPQNPETGWRKALDPEEYARIKETYLNTVGNLTLSGNNGKLGNKLFLEKRDMDVDGKEQGYKFSRLWLNRDLQKLNDWNEETISKRADRIADRFLEVWPAPDVVLEDQVDLEETNIFDADEPRHRKLEYAVFFGDRIVVTQVARLYRHVFKQLLEIQPDAFVGTELGARLAITEDTNKLRQALAISDTLYIEGNIDNSTKFDRIKQALTALEIEEELSIKYAN